MKVALATSTTPAVTGRRSRGMVTPCGLRLDGVVKANTGFDNASSERSREPVMLEQSEASKNAGLFTPNNNHCKSNFKKKPALCEQQLLLAANKDKEWGIKVDDCRRISDEQKRVRTSKTAQRKKLGGGYYYDDMGMEIDISLYSVIYKKKMGP